MVWNISFIWTLFFFFPLEQDIWPFKLDFYHMQNEDINEHLLSKNFCEDYMK